MTQVLSMLPNLPNLPISVINKITQYVSEINDDDYVIKFCDVGNINKQTKRLCLCYHCSSKIRTKMFIVLNKEKFEPKLEQFYKIKNSYKKQSICIQSNSIEQPFYVADMVCIKQIIIVRPGWAREEDTIEIFETFLLSYDLHKPFNKTTNYILLKDVKSLASGNGIKNGSYGIISTPKKQNYAFINNIQFIDKICYLNDIMPVPFAYFI
jgi:hypothetical protein